ncbi:MAG: HU family DNA-binding protein [Sulfuricella sp.]|nr:HU family DNA-binding protein [Sulfuricella sp.]
MNKGELIDAVAKITQHSKSQTGEMFDAFMAVVQNALTSGNDVQMIGFGTFAVEERAARTGRNPATGKALKIPAKRVVKFKVGSKLKEAVASSKGK